MQKQLQFLGLDEKTIALYCAGVQAGPQPVAELAKLARVKRPSVYPLLERLEKHGLVTRTVTGTKTRYEMADPSTVKELLKERESQAHKLLTALPGEIRKLSPKRQGSLAPHIRITQGEQEFWRVVDLVQRSRGEICWIGNLDGLLYRIPEQELFRRFSAKRMRKKVTTRAITVGSIKNHRLFREQVGSYRQFRFLDRLDSPVILALWENKIGILDPDNDCAYIEIQDDAIASFFQQIFNLLWNALK